MEHLSADRRRATPPQPFPLIDKKGHQVVSNRRSGHERRKNKRDSDVAADILNILH